VPEGGAQKTGHYQASGAQNIAQDIINGDILFTYRGLSGPAVLQISSLWESGDSISISHGLFGGRCPPYGCIFMTLCDPRFMTVHPMHFEKYHYSSRLLRDSFMCLPAFRTGAVAGMTVLLTAIRTCSITAGTNNMKPVVTYIEGAFWMEA